MKPRPPLDLEQLRAIQSRNRDPDTLALLWEVKRLHGVLHEVDGCRKIIEKEWAHEVGGHFVAIWRLRILLSREPGL